MFSFVILAVAVLWALRELGLDMGVLLGMADRNPRCLEEPKPLFLFKGYGDSALEFQFSVWATQENFYSLRTELYLAIKRAFDENGIEIPFPHLSLYSGSASEPLRVRLLGDEGKNPGET